MKIFIIIYIILGILISMYSIPKAVKKVKKDSEGNRDLFSQLVQDYADNQIIYLILLIIITIGYPLIFLQTLIKTIKDVKGRSK